ncbi:MAG: PAS domain-containing protein [Mesorhizobium sp.]|nr:MAG: PAS domain-containing protein [Mesorhizobium sp.]RWH02935.1 MAG: PAS domain-containing protein [Mesorhizobium sp.]TIN48937.1 MAG: PAS domain-containing protein [Mesorhizobium sp.]TIR95644.1 MAG: PAS domain-containing protein [Mesorhizobium sp.]TIS04729.1 MAG: PAS domain-containing protein [Mesorhizobium sp.]
MAIQWHARDENPRPLRLLKHFPWGSPKTLKAERMSADLRDVRDSFFAAGSARRNRSASSIVQPCVLESWHRIRDSGQGITDTFGLLSLGEIAPDDVPQTSDIGSIIHEAMVPIPERHGGCLCFYDQNGSLSELHCDDAVKAALIDRGISTGISFLETIAGTNAVDLTLRTRATVATVGAQHTCRLLDDLWMVACPLIFPDAELRGAVALIGTGEDVPAFSHQMVAGAAKLMTSHLRNLDLTRKLSQLLQEQKAIIDSISDGLLVVARDGNVQHLNSHAARILGVDPVLSVGRKFSELIDFDPIIYPLFQNGTGYKDEELLIRTPMRTLHLSDTAVPIKDDAGNVASIVNTFREFSDLQKVAHRLGGTRAVYRFEDIVGHSAKIQSAVRAARKAARTDGSILLLGESGTGKKLFAQAIHLGSGRANGPFVAINCAALSRDLIEEELFGRVGGVIDGVNRAGRPGKFELAAEGTLFLDEISAMPLDLQVKLLEVLQERSVVRLGGAQSFSVNFRLIAASNTPLVSLVESGEFRRDLLFRLSVIDIVLPPLRERQGDVDLLVSHYMEKYASDHSRDNWSIPTDTMASLRAYNWPGNVRELQNAVERLSNNANDFSISDIESPDFTTVDRKIYENPAFGFRLRPLQDHEKDIIDKTLKMVGYNMSKAARELRISKVTLYKKIKDYSIELRRPIGS